MWQWQMILQGHPHFVLSKSNHGLSIREREREREKVCLGAAHQSMPKAFRTIQNVHFSYCKGHLNKLHLGMCFHPKLCCTRHLNYWGTSSYGTTLCCGWVPNIWWVHKVGCLWAHCGILAIQRLLIYGKIVIVGLIEIKPHHHLL